MALTVLIELIKLMKQREVMNWTALSVLGMLSEKKRDYVGKIPKLGGGSDPNPLLDVYTNTQKL